MNKKKLVTTLGSLALVGALGVGATLAYLTDETSTIQNTFVIGNGIDITLTEQKYENGAAVPGQRLDADTTSQQNNYPEIVAKSSFIKDPTTTVKKDSNDCWVFMHVQGVDAFEQINIDGIGDADLSITGWNEAWTKMDDNSKKDGWYAYNTKVTEEMTKNDDLHLPALFTGVQVADYEKVVNKTINDITIQSYAIQADGLTLEQAYQEIIK